MKAAKLNYADRLMLKMVRFVVVDIRCFTIYNLLFQLYLEYNLKPTWDWLITIMDSTEAQLRFGSALSNTTDTTSPSHPLHVSNTRPARERLTREEPRILQVVETRRRARFGTVGKGESYANFSSQSSR